MPNDNLQKRGENIKITMNNNSLDDNNYRKDINKNVENDYQRY